MSKAKRNLSVIDLQTLLDHNGWQSIHEGSLREEYNHVCQLIIQTDYCLVAVRAFIEHPEEEGDWDFGIAMLQATSLEDPPPFFMKSVIKGMLQACELAEDNLLTIGAPFRSYYQFSGGNVANKQNRNDALRRKWGIDHILGIRA